MVSSQQVAVSKWEPETSKARTQIERIERIGKAKGRTRSLFRIAKQIAVSPPQVDSDFDSGVHKRTIARPVFAVAMGSVWEEYPHTR